MKPLNAGQIIILLIVGLVTVAYLSARNYSKNSGDYGEFDILIEKSFPLEGQDTVDLALSSENIYITVGTTDSFELRYENHVFSEKAKKDMLESIVIEDTGSTIKVHKDHIATINMNWIDSLFYFMDNGFQSDVMSGKLEVVIPRDYDQKLILTSSSGNIEVLDASCDELVATASSGRINVVDVTVDGDLVTTTSSGNQTLDEVEANEIDATASSGKITINGHADTLESTTSSGNIEVNANVNDIAKLNASSGTIRFTGEADSADATTTSGNIYLELETIVDEYDVQSSSGTINVTLPRDAEFTFESRTSSGNFKPEIDLDYSKNSDDYAKGYYGKKNADAYIQLSSTSGNQYLKQ